MYMQVIFLLKCSVLHKKAVLCTYRQSRTQSKTTLLWTKSGFNQINQSGVADINIPDCRVKIIDLKVEIGLLGLGEV